MSINSHKPTFYAGFAEGLIALEREPLHDRMVTVPAWQTRAYLDDQGNMIPIDQRIHWKPMQESWYYLDDIEKVIADDPSCHGGLYGGIAGRFNLDAIIAAKSSAVLFVDINPAQTMMWREFIKKLAQHEKLEDFIMDMAGITPPENAEPGFLRSLDERTQYRYQDDLANFAVHCEKKFQEAGGHFAEFLEDAQDHYRNIRDDMWPSVFRGGSRGELVNWFLSGFKYLDTNSWCNDEDKYRHLHLLAKSGAMGALTLDIADPIACEQLNQYLESVHYQPMQEVDGELRPCGEPQTGLRFSLFYRSNVQHYFEYDEETIEKTPERALDFSKRAVHRNTARIARGNLYRMMEADGHLIASDAHPGSDTIFSSFYPQIFSMREIDKQSDLEPWEQMVDKKLRTVN